MLLFKNFYNACTIENSNSLKFFCLYFIAQQIRNDFLFLQVSRFCENIRKYQLWQPTEFKKSTRLTIKYSLICYAKIKIIWFLKKKTLSEFFDSENFQIRMVFNGKKNYAFYSFYLSSSEIKNRQTIFLNLNELIIVIARQGNPK